MKNTSKVFALRKRFAHTIMMLSLISAPSFAAEEITIDKTYKKIGSWTIIKVKKNSESAIFTKSTNQNIDFPGIGLSFYCSQRSIHAGLLIESSFNIEFPETLSVKVTSENNNYLGLYEFLINKRGNKIEYYLNSNQSRNLITKLHRQTEILFNFTKAYSSFPVITFPVSSFDDAISIADSHCS